MVLLAFQIGTPGQTKPQTAFSLSPIRIAQLKGVTWLYTESDTTIDDMPGIVAPAFDSIRNSLAEKGDVPAGGPVIEFESTVMDPAKTFKLRVGYPVADGFKPIGGFQVGKLDSLKCATAIYMGPSRQLPAAYARLFAQIEGQGLTPSGLRRERYLYFEDRASPNDIILIEIALKD
jgi:effector-binding domain-containing protein